MVHDPRFPIQQVYEYPYGEQGQPQPPPSDDQRGRGLYEVTGPMGAPPPGAQGAMLRDDRAFDNFQKVPAFYTITIVLDGEAGAEEGGATPIRPEAFILERVTWACNESPLDYEGELSAGAAIGGSPQGRAVRITWGDEFTNFMGKQACMLSALFGDGDGFLNLRRGILLQGRQTITAALSRISDPTKGNAPKLEFDINFQGVGLFPKDGGGASGAAG